MGLKKMVVAVLAGWLVITPTMASDDWKAEAENWKAEAEKWKSEAEKWQAMVKWYEAKYGWINDNNRWCRMNRSVGNIFGYDEPNCFKPSEPYCVKFENCNEWEVQRYKSELEQWVTCRNEYIREAQDDAGCALLKIKDRIDETIERE